MAASLPYHEPGIVDILTLSSFLLVLNVINSLLDRTLYCGLVGQVLIGVAWGTPGGKWLSSSSLEPAVGQLGYLGLIMIVFEGGLSTSLAAVKANLLLSACVALTGIAAPVALSFFLVPMLGASYIQCFAAGAALCSTSLGTTFTVLSTSGLVNTRLGSVLSTAAMMDDVIGLVMVQIVSGGLGGSGAGGSEISPVTVVRPVLVSLAFAVLVPLACRFLLGPLILALNKMRSRHAGSLAARTSQAKQTVFVFQTMLLLALVVGASYAGASVLLAAYLAGIVGASWDSKVLESIPAQTQVAATRSEILEEASISRVTSESTEVRSRQPDRPADSPAIARPVSEQHSRTSASEMYQLYYAPSVERVLKPFFFASIGFSIPISRMFSGTIIWRGLVYSVLMLLGKALCGLWLIRFSVSPRQVLANMRGSAKTGSRAIVRLLRLEKLVHQPNGINSKIENSAPGSQAQGSPLRAPQEPATFPSVAEPTGKKSPENPLSLYPAGIMAFAMVARGEIGFLISSVAESNGIFRGSSTTSAASSEDGEEASEIFLIVTWAIVLCTIIGPFCVGLLVRRVKKLEAGTAVAQVDGHKKNVLGAWGVS